MLVACGCMIKKEFQHFTHQSKFTKHGRYYSAYENSRFSNSKVPYFLFSLYFLS